MDIGGENMRRSLVLSVLAIIGVISAIGFVSAYGYGNGFGMKYMRYTGLNETNPWYEEHHEKMEEILEEGTYQDLVEYRNEIGMPVMPWVTDEESFLKAKERHEVMEEFHETYGYGTGPRNGPGYGGYRGGRGYGLRMGCLMIS